MTPVMVGGNAGSKLLKEMGSEWGVFCTEDTENRRDEHNLLDTQAFLFLFLSKPVTLQMTVVQERKVVNKD